MAGLMIIPSVFAFLGGDPDTLQAGAPLMFVTMPKAVSYTHLDVYKRQYSIQSPPSALRAAEGPASAKQRYYTTINSLREPGPDGWLAEAAINRIMSGI